MGLALDESENAKETVVVANDIPIIYDDDVARFFASDLAITIDFVETQYGSGFIVDTGTSCS